MRNRSIINFTLSVLLLFVFGSCGGGLGGSPPVFKNIDLTVTNFISNCKAGDAANGTGLNDVNYTATIIVTYNQNGNGTTYIAHQTQTVTAPVGANKGTFVKSINIPSNKAFRVKVIIDASECSICNVGGCPLIEQPIGGQIYYAVNKPYWEITGQWAEHPQNARTMTPVPKPRSIPVSCQCQVKKN